MYQGEKEKKTGAQNIVKETKQHQKKWLQNNNNNNNNIYLLQLGCHPVAVVILHVNKHEIGYY